MTVLSTVEGLAMKVLPAIGLPTLPGLSIIPTWFLEEGLKKIADYGVHYLEDPAHLMAFKQHVRDHLIADLKARTGDKWVTDFTKVLDALFGLAPADNVKVVSNAGDVEAVEGDAPIPAPKPVTPTAPPTSTPTPAPSSSDPGPSSTDQVTATHQDATVTPPPKT